MRKRNILNSPRLLEIKKRRKKIFFRRILLFFTGFLIIFAVFAYVLQIDSINISGIEILGNKITETTLIKGAVNDELAGKYLWLFPKTNLFIYPRSGIKNILVEKFKRLENIELSIRENKVLQISVSERKAEYIWCGNTPNNETKPQNEKECYFLDNNGYVFDKAPYFSEEVYFKFYGKVTDDSDPIGLHFFDQYFNSFLSFKKTLENIALKPVGLYNLGDGDAKIYLSSESSLKMGPEIIFKIDADYQKLAENLQSILTTDAFYVDFKKNYSQLEYIDLRYGSKIYYKFANGKSSVTEGN